MIIRAIQFVSNCWCRSNKLSGPTCSPNKSACVGLVTRLFTNTSSSPRTEQRSNYILRRFYYQLLQVRSDSSWPQGKLKGHLSTLFNDVRTHGGLFGNSNIHWFFFFSPCIHFFGICFRENYLMSNWNKENSPPTGSSSSILIIAPNPWSRNSNTAFKNITSSKKRKNEKIKSKLLPRQYE